MAGPAGISRLSAGRSISALVNAPNDSAAPVGKLAAPGVKSTNWAFSAPANSEPINWNGAVIAFSNMLPMICQMIGPRRNLGSSSEPITGTFRSMTPFLSFSSAVARRTGSGTASLLSVAAPHSS